MAKGGAPNTQDLLYVLLQGAPLLAQGTRADMRRVAAIWASIDTDEHILCLGLGQGLSGKNVLYLRGADAEGHGAESAMGGRVRVAAYCCTSGESKALLRSDNVNNALPLVSHSKVY